MPNHKLSAPGADLSTGYSGLRYRRFAPAGSGKKFLYYIIENIMINVAIFMIFVTYNPFREEFLTMNLHPLLIVVALMALKYGNYLGVLSAFMAGITFLYTYHLLGKDLVLFVAEWSHYKFILMFFLTAVLLGTFKDRSDYAINNLTDELNSAKEELAELIETEKKSQFINEELKKQIVRSEDSILALYEVASALETVNSEEVFTETMALMARFVRARTVSIYTVDKRAEYLRLKIRMGNFSKAGASLKIGEHDYLEQVVKGQKIIKVNAESKGAAPVFSAPLVRNQQTIAVINVEETDLLMVTEYYYNLFKLTVEWISKALVRAIEVEQFSDQDYFYENTRIMKAERFNQRLNEEKRRLSNFGLKFGLFSFKKGEYVLADFNLKLNEIIRQVDVIGYDPLEDEMHILLPVTSPESASAVKERILSAFNYKLKEV